MEEHKREIKELSRLSKEESDRLFKELKSKIEIIPKEKFGIFLSKANELISDPNDTEYIALSLYMKDIPIWSEDKHFKQQLLIRVFATDELIKYLKLSK